MVPVFALCGFILIGSTAMRASAKLSACCAWRLALAASSCASDTAWAEDAWLAAVPSPKFHPAVIQRGGLISENVSYGGCATHKKRHRDMRRPGSTGTLLLSGFHDCFENGSKSRFRQPDRNDGAGRRALASTQPCGIHRDSSLPLDCRAFLSPA